MFYYCESMAIETACFISYRHRKSAEAIELVRAIHDELREQLSLIIEEEPFWDASLDYGEIFTDRFAAVISRSACMLVAYTPVYALGDYSRAEFKTMEIIEHCRLSRLGDKAKRSDGMIIPIILKKHPKDDDHPDPWLPHEVQGKYHYFDISPYILSGARNLRKHRKFKEEISRIADYIVRVKKMIERDPDHCNNCKSEIVRGVPEWGASDVEKFPLR